MAIASLLETGYSDFLLLRSLADLEVLQKAKKFEGLLRMFERNRDSAGNMYVPKGSEAAKAAEETDTRSAAEKFIQGSWLFGALTGTTRVTKRT